MISFMESRRQCFIPLVHSESQTWFGRSLDEPYRLLATPFTVDVYFDPIKISYHPVRNRPTRIPKVHQTTLLSSAGVHHVCHPS